MSKHFLLPFALLLCLPLGCSGGADANSTENLGLSAGGPMPGFLERMPRAPFTTRYYARRHVTQLISKPGAPAQMLEYTERVWSDGQGGFRVEAEQLIQPSLPPAQHNLFLLLQTAREGFMYRVRDFRIQDLPTFLRGYSIRVVGSHLSVAGQPVERLEVTPRAGSGYHTLDVVPQTGLVLRCVQYDANAVEIGRVETLEYSANPDLSQVTLHQELPVQDLDLANTAAQLGYELRAPTLVPDGFERTKSERVDLGGETWARLSYTDGADQLFFLHRRTGGGLTMNDPLTAHSLRVFNVGPWTILDAKVNHHRFLAAGRQSKDQLQMMIESALP